MSEQKLGPKEQKAPEKIVRILPQTLKRPSDQITAIDVNTARPDGFFVAYGVIGVSLFNAACISVCWTLWLLVLNLWPNETANYLMGTSDFDDGHFWLIIDPEPEITLFNAITLAAIVVSYIHVLLKMTVLRNSKFKIASVGPTVEEIAPTLSKYIHEPRVFWVELTGYHGHYRKFWNILFKVADLTVEAIQLHHMLEAGISKLLTYEYAVLIACNCLSQAFFILCPVAHTAFSEVLVDTMFDMCFAVMCPIKFMIYLYITFDFDRALARLYSKVYNVGSFQRQARMQSDPVTTTLFCFAFDALRTLTWSNLLIRVTLNVSFSYRLSRLVAVIYQRRKKRQTSSSKVVRIRIQRNLPRWVGSLFIGLSIFVLIYTHLSISESQKACQAYRQCVAFAHRWNSHGVCPCLALVDVVKTPTTFEEWTNPKDVTDTVKALATSGKLQVLQLTNRQMAVWPEELERCTDLKYLSLYHTEFIAIPDWFSGFRKLEFLDLQGKVGGPSIRSMPPDAFSNMGSLTFMHLGCLPQLQQLPSFQGLHNLKSVSLALLTSISYLPDLKPLAKLQRLELVALDSLRTIPDTTSINQLVKVVVWQAQFCCNGFLGACNLSDPVCATLTTSDCVPLADRPSDKSQAFLASHTGICDKSAPYIPPAKSLLKSQIDVCGGVLYRQCRDPLFESRPIGICVGLFFQVITCNSFDPYAIYGREQEILHGVGLPCDPEEEAWLGCHAKQS